MSDPDRKDPSSKEELEKLVEGDTLPPKEKPKPDPALLANADTAPALERHRGRKLGVADTAPQQAVDPESIARAETAPSVDTREVTAQRASARTATFPPARWDREDSVISSASSAQVAREVEGVESITAEEDERLTEVRAREILNARFKAAGIEIQPDYHFCKDDLVVTLDGYDPERSLGYAYLSHSDADVVTDLDPATELAFEELAGLGKVNVLVVHDTDVPTQDALERRIDAFFVKLRARFEETQRF